MSRDDFDRFHPEALIEPVLPLQRPEKMARISSKPPAAERKARREQTRLCGAKPGHESRSPVMSDTPDTVVAHRPERCRTGGTAISADLPGEFVSAFERVNQSAMAPLITRLRRSAVRCPCCGLRIAAPAPAGAQGTPFGSRLPCSGAEPGGPSCALL